MKHSIIILSTFLLLFSSCKKNKVVIPESNDPIFKTEGTFGSNSFSIIAGDDNAYMYTMTSSENGVDVISGQIENSSFGIEIGVYDGGIDQPAHDFNADIQLTPIFSTQQTQPIVVLNKNSFVNSGEIQNIIWTINSDSFQDNAPIYSPGKYMVCAEIHFYNNSIKNLCDELIIGYNRNETGLMEFDYDLSSHLFSAYIAPINSSISSIEWYVDDILVSSSTTLSMTMTPYFHSIKVHIQYSNGVYREKEMVLDGADNLRNVEDFTFFENQSTAIPQDYNFRINFSQNGTVYESALANNTNSTVQITNYSYYGQNSNGFDVYKIDAIVNCIVKSSGSSNEIPLNFTTAFGVEIK